MVDTAGLAAPLSEDRHNIRGRLLNKLDELRKAGERIFSGKVEAEKVPGLYTSFKDHHAYLPV